MALQEEMNDKQNINEHQTVFIIRVYSIHCILFSMCAQNQLIYQLLMVIMHLHSSSLTAAALLLDRSIYIDDIDYWQNHSWAIGTIGACLFKQISTTDRSHGQLHRNLLNYFTSMFI